MPSSIIQPRSVSTDSFRSSFSVSFSVRQGRPEVAVRLEKVVKIGAKVVSHGRYAIFQMAEVAVPRELFGRILPRIARLRPPDPAPC